MSGQWRAIPGFDRYRINECGEIRTLAGRKLNPHADKDGYWSITLTRDGKEYGRRVHRLVLLAFVGEPPEAGMHAAHNDGDPGNCHLANLRWATPAANNADKVRHGTVQRGANSPVAKLTERDIPAILVDRRACHVVASSYGVSVNTIQNIKQRRVWSWVAPEITPFINKRGGRRLKGVINDQPQP